MRSGRSHSRIWLIISLFFIGAVFLAGLALLAMFVMDYAASRTLGITADRTGLLWLFGGLFICQIVAGIGWRIARKFDGEPEL